MSYNFCYFRWSCCCHLHRHTANIHHDCRCNYPDNYWYVSFKTTDLSCRLTDSFNSSDWWCISIAFNEIGGYSNLEHVYSIAVPSKIIPNSTCHLPRQDAMHLFRDAVTGDLPWPGMTLGLTILATWYWCTDQVCLTHTLRHRAQVGNS